jgi:hypothetical protein
VPGKAEPFRYVLRQSRNSRQCQILCVNGWV